VEHALTYGSGSDAQGLAPRPAAQRLAANSLAALAQRGGYVPPGDAAAHRASDQAMGCGRPNLCVAGPLTLAREAGRKGKKFAAAKRKSAPGRRAMRAKRKGNAMAMARDDEPHLALALVLYGNSLSARQKWD
jgi:hypothetical protein